MLIHALYPPSELEPRFRAHALYHGQLYIPIFIFFMKFFLVTYYIYLSPVIIRLFLGVPIVRQVP